MADVKNKWESSSWGRKLIVQKKRASLNDFDRFKLMLAKIKVGDPSCIFMHVIITSKIYIYRCRYISFYTSIRGEYILRVQGAIEFSIKYFLETFGWS